MKKLDAFLIGHISRDQGHEIDGREYDFYGGTALFGVYAANSAGNRVGLLTKMSAYYRPEMDLLPIPGDQVYFIESQKNTSMTNYFLSEDRERRQLVVKSVADPFRLDEIPNVEAEVFHLGGLIYGDFENGMIEGLASRGRVSVDMQGYLRRLTLIHRNCIFRIIPISCGNFHISPT